MCKFKIYPLLVGEVIRDSSGVAYQHNPGVPIKQPLISWYVTNEKEKIIIDTAGEPADGIKHMPYSQTNEQFLDKALLNIGIKPEEITNIILTHLHWDHAGNNHLFKNANKFYVQKKELQYAVTPLDIHKKYYNLPEIFKTKYEIIDGDVEIIDGISVVLTPGHSDGSQTIIINTDGGKYAITGDLIPIYQCWESSPRLANGLHTDLEKYYKSYEKLEKLGIDYILPGHDFKIFEHNVYPIAKVYN